MSTPKKKGAAHASEEEKFKIALAADAELSRLTRQYALLVLDRQQVFGSNHLQKQKAVMNVFLKEHNEILEDLRVAITSTEDTKNFDKLTDLLIEYDYYSEKVKQKHKHIREIEGQIKVMKKQNVDMRSKMETDRQHEDRIKYISNVVETLENKLELQMRKFGSICWDNRKMREEIDHMMHQRANFLKVWNCLIRRLTVGKKYMMDLIEQATIAYDQREEWWQKLSQLRLKAHQDLMMQVDLMRGYNRRQDDSHNLETFIGIKGQKRLMMDLKEKRRLKRAERTKTCRETLHKHEKLLESILNFTKEFQMDGNGDGNIETICNNFVKGEQKNLMNFLYINDVIAELEVFGDRLGFLRDEIDKKRVCHEMRINQQSYRIEEIEDELQQARTERKASQAELEQCHDNLATMISGINVLIRIVHCDTDPMLKLLGKNNHIHDYNVLFFLELLERRVADLVLKFHHKVQHQEQKKTPLDTTKVFTTQHDEEEESSPASDLFLMDQLVDATPCPLCVEHEFLGGGDVIDSVVRKVWNLEEARNRLKMRLDLPDGLERIHTVSHCLLPKSRQIIQKRYQT